MERVWVEHLAVRDLRNIKQTECTLGQGLNVFAGRNAQGKTSVLEAVGLASRARSFRTDDPSSVVRRGESRLLSAVVAREAERSTRLEVQIGPEGRQLRIDERTVRLSDYHGRLEVAVYSTDRLKVVKGSMRDRRQFLDRSAGALWPAYRRLVSDHEKVAAQRAAALESRSADQEAWDERLIQTGAAVRLRRARYAARLREGLLTEYRPEGEEYGLGLCHEESDEAQARDRLRSEIRSWAGAERRAGRSLVGPQRDRIELSVGGADAANASSGQARSLLLALTLAVLAVHRTETGRSAVALLDDLDSELDEQRASELCQRVSERGQALVTTAHPDWARRVAEQGRMFEVSEGQVRAA